MSAKTSPDFVILVTGRAEIPHTAERARIDVAVASSGTNKAAVSDEVITTAKHIEALCRALSPLDESSTAKEDAAIAHWSKTGLSATSEVPYHDTSKNTSPPPRQYHFKIDFDIRFRDFSALGGFGSKLSALPHVEVTSITWLLMPATEKSYRSQLRKDATRDALQKARDYCEVLECSEIRPIQLNEGGQSGFSSYTDLNNVAMSSLNMQNAQGLFGNATNARAFAAYGGPSMEEEEEEVDERREASDLAFEPQELKMSMEVSIKFVAK